MDRFRIDWNNLPKLWSRPRCDDDWRKLIRCHKGPKNHSVNREKSYADRAKAAKFKKAKAEQQAQQHAFKDACRAYWRGERDTHP